MKRFISFFISIICLFSFSACQNSVGVQPVFPTPIPVVKNEEKFLSDLEKDGQTEEIVISYTSEESLWLGASLDLTVKINDTDFIADISMLPEEYAILHTQYFTLDVDGDETQEIVFSCENSGSISDRKVFIFKYADGTITQLPSIMTVDLTKPEGYELFLSEITAEQERLKATFFFYQHDVDFETEQLSVFLSYQNGVWKVEG